MHSGYSAPVVDNVSTVVMKRKNLHRFSVRVRGRGFACGQSEDELMTLFHSRTNARVGLDVNCKDTVL